MNDTENLTRRNPNVNNSEQDKLNEEKSDKSKHRLTSDNKDEYLEQLLNNVSESDSDDELPYRGKVFLARKKKPDSWACIAVQASLHLNRSNAPKTVYEVFFSFFQIALVVAVLSLAYYAYYYFEHMHVNVIRAYAHLGFDTAQNELGNRYLHGIDA
jgi:hypothetical protein